MSGSPAGPVDSKRLQDKVAIITGGARGLGESTARVFIRHGAKVVIADIEDSLGLALCEELGLEGTVSYVHCDVTREADVQHAVDTTISRYGKLDIMFNNAGIWGGDDSSIAASDAENFRRVMDVNVLGAYLGAKHAARVMIPAGTGGCILFTASVYSVTSNNLSYAYTASKHAVVGLTKNLSVELGRHGIRANCISPYVVPTAMVRHSMGMEKERAEAVAARAATLKGTVLEAKDVAEAALYLASDESKYVSGLNLVVDGGFSVINPMLEEIIRSETNIVQ